MSNMLWQCTVGPISHTDRYDMPSASETLRRNALSSFTGYFGVRSATCEALWLDAIEDAEFAPIRNIHYRKKNGMTIEDENLAVAQVRVEDAIASGGLREPDRAVVAAQVITLLKQLRGMK